MKQILLYMRVYIGPITLPSTTLVQHDTWMVFWIENKLKNGFKKRQPFDRKITFLRKWYVLMVGLG
jgi:hypothetical protein